MNGLILFKKDCIFRICNLFEKKYVFFHIFFLTEPSDFCHRQRQQTQGCQKWVEKKSCLKTSIS